MGYVFYIIIVSILQIFAGVGTFVLVFITNPFAGDYFANILVGFACGTSIGTGIGDLINLSRQLR